MSKLINCNGDGNNDEDASFPSFCLYEDSCAYTNGIGHDEDDANI